MIARRGEQVQFQPQYLELAGHYCFAPQPCRIRRANEKGRVERAIRYLRESFFAARAFANLVDLNAQARSWRDEVAHQRPWPQDPSRTVAEVFAEEQQRLHPLPQHPFSAETLRPVGAKKTCFVRFDTNDYSIPPELVDRPLTLCASDTVVRILDSGREVARHLRSYDKRQLIEDPAHRAALLALKRRALGAVSSSVLIQTVPEAERFLDRAFTAGESTAAVTRHLEQLLGLYGADALRAAVITTLDGATASLAALRYVLEKQRRSERRSHRPTLDLGDRPELRSLHVQPHSLEDYDGITDPDA